MTRGVKSVLPRFTVSFNFTFQRLQMHIFAVINFEYEFEF